MGECKSKEVHNELAKANRKIVTLELKLKKAETIIDIQKKISEILKNDEILERSIENG